MVGILSLVSTGLAKKCLFEPYAGGPLQPVAIVPVVDLNVTLRLALAWRRDNNSPLLASFIAEVARLPEERTLNRG